VTSFFCSLLAPRHFGFKTCFPTFAITARKTCIPLRGTRLIPFTETFHNR
jgi:hypothetical protein